MLKPGLEKKQQHYNKKQGISLKASNMKSTRIKQTSIPITIVVVSIALALSSYCSISNIAGTSGNQKVQQDSTYHYHSTHPNIPHISFFGKLVVLDDSTHIMQQITEIVESDTMLSISGRVLTVGQVGFGINIHSGFLSLLSSTQVDDPKIKEVVEYLSSIYGEPEEDEPDDYWWRESADGDNLGRLIVRMRPLHSEEGGTVLFFE